MSGYVPSCRVDRDLVACWHERDRLLKEVEKLKRLNGELVIELEHYRNQSNESRDDRTTTQRTLGMLKECAERQIGKR